MEREPSLRTFSAPAIAPASFAKDTTFWSGRPLPSDLVQESSARLRFASLLFAASFMLVWIFEPKEARPAGVFPMLDVATAAAIVASLAIAFAAGKLRHNPVLLGDLGLVYEVIFCFAVAISEQWLPWDITHAPRGISWVCLALIAFPLTVPTTPGKALLAALAAATMGPVALLIAVVKGNPLPPLENWLALFLPTYFAAGCAYLLSRTIYKLGRDVGQARQLGSYVLLERLGGGGMGEVWRARHRLLARPAAVKLIRPELLGPVGAQAETVLRRFEHEARATSLLESPHTISLYDFGRTADGTFYYVMELLDGFDLETLVQRFGPLPPERAIWLMRQVCKSLAEAHERGMIHRDIKPANIIICRRGIDHDFVKVLDFGLVITHPDAEERLTRLTAQGMTSGTPSYMAPEMADSSKAIDARADLYALGCVAYWMLTGLLVFDSESSVKFLVDHAYKRPLPPSERTGLPFPADLETVIMRCLEKEASLRPKDARELSAMLERCAAAGEWSQERAEAWWREHAASLPLRSSERSADEADPPGDTRIPRVSEPNMDSALATTTPSARNRLTSG